MPIRISGMPGESSHYASAQASGVVARPCAPSVIYPVAEFRRKHAADDPFLRDVLDHEKLFLIGNPHDLAKLAGDSPAGEI